MKDVSFSSVMADRLTAYVEFRRALGYELRLQVFILRKFDRVIQQNMTHPGPITREIVESFRRSLDGLQPITRRMQLSTVRQFLLFLCQFEPQTFIPDRSLQSTPSSPRAPHIYTDEEIQILLKEALRYPWRYHRVLARQTYHTLIAFLYATGLRISEALALTVGDIDWQKAVLHIRKTKFHKARLVPLKSSSCAGIRRYLIARAEQGQSTTPDSPLFVYGQGRRLLYHTVSNAFLKIARRAGVRGPVGTRGPRIHDLRHTAAVQRLYIWYREGKDVQALLPALATYLGHTSVSCTEIYLTTTAELLAEASKRFEHHFKLDP